MASNAQKTPLALSLNPFAEQKVADAIRQIGKALPCSVVAVNGQIVTVSFDVSAAPWTLPNVTIPIATSRYDWLPIQIGDQGYTAAADAYLGGVSGLGGGTADLTQRGNLSALVFTPVSNASWTTENENFRVVQGPAGVLVQDLTGAATFTITKSPAQITGVVGGVSIVISGTGIAITGDLTVTGNVTAAFGGAYVDLLHHVHQDSGGSGDGGPPVTNT